VVFYLFGVCIQLQQYQRHLQALLQYLIVLTELPVIEILLAYFLTAFFKFVDNFYIDYDSDFLVTEV
jgi:hypothetical protein